MRSDGREGMNVRTVINVTNNNECNKCNNKEERNNKCTVSRLENVYISSWQSRVAVVQFFCLSCLKTEILFEDRVIFISNFLFENRIVRLRDVRKPRFDCKSY